MSNQELEQEISKLENDVKRLEDSTKEIIQSIKERIQNLKDIVWDRQSKKESSQMYKVLKEEKESTQVKSNVGDIKVDKEFMEKEIQKHLNDPSLRGMVTTEEMLSFPKVAKNVKAEYDKRTNSYTWKAKADDESAIRYGSREYEKESERVNRLLTTYSETEYGERQDRGEQGQLRREFNDRDFLRPANEIIPQPKVQAKQNPTQSQANFDLNEFNKLSLAEKLAQLQRNQESISQIPKVSEILKNQESINDLDSLQRDSNQDSKDLQQENDLRESQHKIRKHK